MVGMPLLSLAFITVVERSCSCGLRWMGFKGFFASDVNPPAPQDDYVPSAGSCLMGEGTGREIHTDSGMYHGCHVIRMSHLFPKEH